MVPNPTYIYHLTHIQNLRSILVKKGLYAFSSLQNSVSSYTNIAYANVQDKRSQKAVPVEPGGVLHDYVPFYFAPRSPMLYTLHHGNVPGYSDGQEPLVYLVSSVQTVLDNEGRYAFTDGHGIIAYTKYFNDESNLDQIDWALMKATFWKDTEQDLDRKRRRQAEFLVHTFFPWNWIIGIATYNKSTRDTVTDILHSEEHQPSVQCRNKWYF